MPLVVRISEPALTLPLLPLCPRANPMLPPGADARPPHSQAYFGAKVSWWVYAVICIISVMGEGPYNCMAVIRSLEFFMACVAVCSSALLAIRTVCVWQNEKAKQVVAWSVGIFGVALAGVWFAGVADIEAMWVPNGGGAWQNVSGRDAAARIPP